MKLKNLKKVKIFYSIPQIHFYFFFKISSKYLKPLANSNPRCYTFKKIIEIHGRLNGGF